MSAAPPEKRTSGLQLDTRQRAMLQEMGIRVWLPAPTPAATPHAVPVKAPPRRAIPIHPAAPAAPAPAATPMPEAAAAARAARAARIARMDWDALEREAAQCRACGLCAARHNVVFGAGSRRARWLVVGEAPGEQEDLQGAPFVGAAGQLLDAMLAALHLSRQSNEAEHAVYIANTLKCRPPGNRNPHPAETALCAPFLQRQIALLAPAVILALGRFAAQALLGSTDAIGRLRARVHRWHGIPLVASYHPAYLLRTPHAKAAAWSDLCLALHAVHTQNPAEAP